MNTTSTSSPLSDLFRASNRPLLVPYATGGFPNLDASRRVLDTYVAAGADIIELGIPFSDPLADGPTIQATSMTALASGVRPADVFDLAAQVTAHGKPVVLMTYLNVVLALGPDRFFADCQKAGVLGVVVPDLPVDEAAELQQTARAHRVDLVLMAAPTSTDARLDRIAAQATGFIYCVAGTGVTGIRAAVDESLPAFLRRLRERTDIPLAVGFGISTAEQAAQVGALADGVIIGSRLMRLLQEAESLDAGLDAVGSFLRSVAELSG